MAKKIGLYDSNNPAYKVYAEYDQQWGPLDKHIVIGSYKDYFFAYREGNQLSRGKKLSGQLEIPIKALEWIVMVIARFKLPSDMGGYPSDQFTDFLQLSKDVDLSVFRGMHHGLGEMCFMIENRASTSYNTELNTQSWDLYDRDMAEHDLLVTFNRIIDDAI